MLDHGATLQESDVISSNHLLAGSNQLSIVIPVTWMYSIVTYIKQ